jgi:molybdate transport system permease protein
LLTFGRVGLIGRYLDLFGITLPFTTAAVVMAQIFVSSPFFVNSARAGLEQLDTRYEQAAYTLRASPFYAFRRVVLPLIRPALLSGIGLAWARALGELGATITFAGNFPGITQTMPIAIYIAAETDIDTAVAISVVLMAVSFGVLLALRVGRGRV